MAHKAGDKIIVTVSETSPCGSVRVGTDAWLWPTEVDGIAKLATINELRAEVGLPPISHGESPYLEELRKPVAEQQESATERKLVRTRLGYGYIVAKEGDYMWLDVGKKAPITVRLHDLVL